MTKKGKKLSKSENICKQGENLLAHILGSKANLFEHYPKNGKVPNIDGDITIIDQDIFLPNHLHYQLKSQERKLSLLNYIVEESVAEYLAKTNVPTLFFIADVTNKKLYWIHIDAKREKQILHGTRESSKLSRTFNLNSREVNVNNISEVHKEWKKISSKGYEESKNQISELSEEFKRNISSVLGFISMFNLITKDRLEDFMKTYLEIDKKESGLLIDKLEENKIISSSKNYYYLNNLKIGLESLSELLGEVKDFSSIEKSLSRTEKEYFYKQLDKLNLNSIKPFLDKKIILIKELIKKKDYQNLYIELLALIYLSRKVSTKEIFAILSEVPSVVKNIKGNEVLQRDIVIRCTQILESVPYLIDIDTTLSILSVLSRSKLNQIKEISDQSTQRIVSFKPRIIHLIGYQIQVKVIEAISRWSNKELKINTEFLILILRLLLMPSYDSMSMETYNTFTHYSGSLPFSSDLKQIRNKSLELLQKLFNIHNNEKIKKEILMAMQSATRFPIRHSYSNKLKALIIDNTNMIIDFYLNVVKKLDNDLLNMIEEHSSWLRNNNIITKQRFKELSSAIVSNPGYKTYKLILGSSRHIPRGMSWSEVDNKRLSDIEKLAKEISTDDFQTLTLKIKKESVDSDNRYFGHLVYSFSKLNPLKALSILNKNKKSISFSFGYLLVGGLESTEKKKFVDLSIKWISKNTNLQQCSFMVANGFKPDHKLIEKLAKKGIKNEDTNAMFYALFAIVRDYKRFSNLKPLLINLIKTLSDNDNYHWINRVNVYEKEIMPTLTKDDLDSLIKCFEKAPDINYDGENLLKHVADHDPKKVISLLHGRLKSQKDIWGYTYRAIPFEFHYLDKSLKKHCKITVQELFKWFKDKNHWFATCHLIADIFKVVDEELEKKLITLFKSKKEKNLQIVFAVLNAYDGKEAINNVCRKMIINTSINDTLWEDIMDTMSRMGCVHGEYGFVHELIKKKERLQQWKKDKNKKVKEYSIKYEKHLNKLIKAHKDRADENIMVRKKEFET